MSVGEIVPATISNQVQYLNKGFEVENFANRVQNKDCVSVSSSSSSSSTLPNDEDEKKVAKPTKSRICIDSSNDVVIGPVTQIHGPITIHQALQQITNDGEKDDADGKLPAKLITSENATGQKSTLTAKCPLLKKRYVAIGATICVVIIVIGITKALTASFGDDDKQSKDPEGVLTLKGGHRVYEKRVWHGREVVYNKLMRQPARYVIISHTAGTTCKNFTQCASVMQQLQAQFVGVVGLSDIGQNFLVAHDGNVYVGRGWDLRNMHTDDSVGIGYLGNFVFDELTPGMIEATIELINYGIREMKISPAYVLVGQNQTYPTDSPGRNVYKVIKEWNHFRPDFIGSY